VSSLQNNHKCRISGGNEKNSADTACWELLSCSEVLCPAHRSDEKECWLISQTLCSSQHEEQFYQKISNCLTCAFFQEKGKHDPEGWDDFLARHLRRHFYKALGLIYKKEESFFEVLNRIPDGLFTTGSDFRITYFNPAAEKITGYPTTKVVGMHCKDVFGKNMCEPDNPLLNRKSDGDDIHNRECLITHIEGRKIPVIFSTSIFKDDSGKIAGYLQIFKDITEIHNMQERIARRERKYRRVFEGSHDMIYTTNNEGKIQEINDAGVEMLGYRNKQEVLALDHVRRLYRNPQDRERFVKLINSEGFVKDYEVEFIKKNGTVINVLISSRKYENPENYEVEYEGIIKDITKRKQAEQIIRQKNLELSVLNNVAVALNLTMDMPYILKLTLKNVIRSLRINRGGVFLLDHVQQTARLEVGLGMPPHNMDTEESVLFKDPELRKHLLNTEGKVNPEPMFPVFKAKYRTEDGSDVPWLSCFLISFKGKAVGFFGLDIPPARVLSHNEYHHMGSLGNFIGGAIENTQMMETINRHQEELSQLTKTLYLNQEEEKRRIARELHDEAGQALTAVRLSLERLEQQVTESPDKLLEDISEIKKLVAQTSSEIRGLSYRLHPTLLVDLGLEPALKLYFKEMTARCKIDIDYRLVGYDKRLDVELETVLYRFCQETLVNTLKHSGAENFRLSIIKSYPKIIFCAEDDGVGFDGHIGGKDQRSLGLIGMRERVAQLGGSFHLLGRPGRGTRIRIELPFKEVEENDESHSSIDR
jgi:PAS domain S-box-containing protein